MERSAENRYTVDGNPPDGLVELMEDTRDALSDPSAAVLAAQNVHHMPPGAAWGTPEGEAISRESVWWEVVLALSAPWQHLYRRAFDLTNESRALTTDELLEEWEADYGLPDKCVPGDQTRSERYSNLLAKVRNTGTITPADYIDAAADIGFRVEIEEVYGFECGFSECGGEHECGDVAQEAYWVVHVKDLPVSYFRVSESELGVDPLFTLPAVDVLSCRFRELAPGWTVPVFQFPE